MVKLGKISYLRRDGDELFGPYDKQYSVAALDDSLWKRDGHSAAYRDQAI
ncbi:hypothetical protein EMIT07CA2_100113 [Brevibacillus sp. IT-7CA2]